MNPQSVFALQQIILFISGVYTECLHVRLSNGAFPYKCMCLTSKVNLTKHVSEKYSACT